MKPYNKSTKASSYYYDPYYGTTTQVLWNLSQKTLDGIISYTGDYKTPNPHAYVKYVRRGYVGKTEGWAGGKLNGLRYGVTAYYNPIGLFPASYEPSALTHALSKAYEQLRGQIDLSIDLVQWRQVTKMVALHRRVTSSIARSSLRLLPQVESINRIKRDLANPKLGRRRAKRLSRELNNSLNYLAEKRLEYVYGWQPSMATMHDLALEFMNPKAPGWLVCQGKGRVFQKKTVLDTSTGAIPPIEHHITISDRAMVQMYFTPQASVLDNLGRISSLNPVAVLYEATPFSFVLDWMWAVGDWIRSIETAFLHRNDFVGGWQTLTQRCTARSSKIGNQYSGGQLFAAYNWRGDAVLTRLTRIKLNSAPYPVRPAKQFSFGIVRQLNAIALAKVTLLRADDLLARRR